LFQFHSGSIQTAITSTESDGTNKFQFHSGSIQTQLVDVENRLRCLFQFHSGSIQTDVLLIDDPLYVRFNSTLVRFKPVRDSVMGFPWEMFQFHSGSIQTCPALSVLQAVAGFQFHSGSIQTLKMSDMHLVLT